MKLTATIAAAQTTLANTAPLYQKMKSKGLDKMAATLNTKNTMLVITKRESRAGDIDETSSL